MTGWHACIMCGATYHPPARLYSGMHRPIKHFLVVETCLEAWSVPKLDRADRDYICATHIIQY